MERKATPFSETEEFINMRKQFEKDLKKMPIYVSSDLDHDIGKYNAWYCNSDVNKIFIGYMWGYALHKALTIY